MALTSMTGFGRGAAAAGGIKVTAELGSVNRRQFDVRVTLPRALAGYEPRVHAMIHKAVARGHITGTVRAVSERGGRVTVEPELAGREVRKLRRLARELGLADDLSARSLLRLPDVIRHEHTEDDPGKVWRLARRALGDALGRLNEMRTREGRALARDLTARFGKLAARVARLKALAPSVPRRHRRQLWKRIREAGVDIAGGDAQLAREAALLADRSDITEEITRLESHLKQASSFIGSRKPAGRPLDFLCQEMFREINTIGSKANDTRIAAQVVRFKSDLEAVREQAQNVE